MKAVHCYQPVERRCKVVHLLASMCTYEILFNVKEPTDSADQHNDNSETQQVALVLSVVVVQLVLSVVVVHVVVVD